jgi:hypothetical protein
VLLCRASKPQTSGKRAQVIGTEIGGGARGEALVYHLKPVSGLSKLRRSEHDAKSGEHPDDGDGVAHRRDSMKVSVITLAPLAAPAPVDWLGGTVLTSTFQREAAVGPDVALCARGGHAGEDSLCAGNGGVVGSGCGVEVFARHLDDDRLGTTGG